jgi:hypothetical protein
MANILLRLQSTGATYEQYGRTTRLLTMEQRERDRDCSQAIIPKRPRYWLFFVMMPFFTGCGSGEPGNQSAAGRSASLAWDPVVYPSVSAYFVHYGRRSTGQMGSCLYEDSIFVDSTSATVTNLAPNTLYYFTVSAYNGLESVCSHEVSIVTSPAPI